MLACPFAVSDFSDADPADSGEMESLKGADLLAKAVDGVLELDKDYYLTDNALSISSDLTIIGNDHKIYGRILPDKIADGDEGLLTIVMENVVIDGGRSANGSGTGFGFIGVHSQNQGKETEGAVRELSITMKGCTVQNFYGKGVYITNGKYIDIDNCIFKDVIDKDETNDSGDHAIDLCIGGVNDAEIIITNNTFIGKVGNNASIQVQQRNPNNGTDDNAGDWGSFPQGTSIKSVYIAYNDFSQVDRNPMDKTEPVAAPADIRLGGWPKADNDMRTYTKAFPATIIASGPTEVVSCTEFGATGNNSPDYDVKITLSNGSEFQVDGEYDENASQAVIDYSLKSGSAVLSGYVPEYMDITFEKGASAVLQDLENYGTVNSVDNNVSGTSIKGSPVVNTNTQPSTSWDDDEDLPPYIPSQSSNDDDTVTIVASAAAAAVAAILAVFLVIDRKG